MTDEDYAVEFKDWLLAERVHVQLVCSDCKEVITTPNPWQRSCPYLRD